MVNEKKKSDQMLEEKKKMNEKLNLKVKEISDLVQSQKKEYNIKSANHSELQENIELINYEIKANFDEKHKVEDINTKPSEKIQQH